MGCVSTKRDGDGNQRRFHVKNLDDENRVVGEGELEVTDTHLVLYSKSQPIKWPLKYLRRYGYDDSLFSFEAGRRCPTGEGIYAFSTRNAEAIFRLVETNIRTGKSKRLTDDESDSAPPASETAGRGASPPADNAVSPTPVAIEPKLVTEGNSESGGGRRFSYAELDLPPANKEWRIAQNPPTNKKRSGYATIDFQATEAAKVPTSPPLNYAQVDFSGKSKVASKPPPQVERTNYAEVIPNLRQSQPSNGAPREPLHYADVSIARPDAARQARQEEIQLAYVQLDLSQSSVSGGATGAVTSGNKKPSTSEVQYSYTQIDFTKTQALSQVASGGGEYANTSSRQTRHT